MKHVRRRHGSIGGDVNKERLGRRQRDTQEHRKRQAERVNRCEFGRQREAGKLVSSIDGFIVEGNRSTVTQQHFSV